MASNILGNLANASKALTAHRFGVTTAGNNMANVNNPDYARQRVVIGEDGVVQTMAGPQGTGIEIQGFEHMRDKVLDRELLRESSLNASLSAQQAAMSKAESNLGQEISRSGDSPFIDGATADDGGIGGIAETINNFFNAFHSLSANPGSDAEKESLLQKADILVEKLNVTSERFSDLHDDLALQVRTDVGSANQMLEEIARLNAEISRAESSKAGQALALRDQRQGVLEDLSKIMQIKTEEIPNSAGQIRVYVPTVGGESPTLDLVERGRFKEVDFDDSGAAPIFTVGDDKVQIEIKSGRVQGALAARDGAIADYRRGLDGLANELVTQINGLYNTGVAPATTNFFADTGDAAELTAAGIKLASGLDASTLRTTNDPDQNLGDNSLVLAIAELDQKKIAGLGNRDFASFYRSTVTDLGENVAKVDARLQDEEIVFKNLKAQREAVSGVNLDEEMTDMMKYQRAFEATGKLIRAIDEMLDVIVNRLV
ncbi:flagellar hook-associated protein FlgK [Pelagicoccus mobilis]|uniref:Flagellar hook-associated protein 1 n=1 Tax=Pelagicoccus mobilis TaxID=415221 RepID=A0A934RZL8_9BACT|nr:flagellar hook-associated protein FlgK [Pelagicoccus mobilis]MBK1878460.1 flagellar hook-associated protein FlgK [Pelagicoccus mobilis]